MKSVKFFFDFLSPYSYISWQLFKNDRFLTEKHRFSYHPIPMGKSFDHYGIKGPALVKPKREYLLKNILRRTTRDKIPFTNPKIYPFNPLYALRLATIKDKQFEMIDSLFSACWVDKVNMEDPDELSSYLITKGFSAKEVETQLYAKETKLELKSNIKIALGLEVFGVPSFVVDDDELFWGSDSMIDLKNFLENKDLFNGKTITEVIK